MFKSKFVSFFIFLIFFIYTISPLYAPPILVARLITPLNIGQIIRGQISSTVTLDHVDNSIPIINPSSGGGAVYLMGAEEGVIHLRKGITGDSISNVVLSNYGTTLSNGTDTLILTGLTHNYTGQVFNANRRLTILVGAEIVVTDTQAGGIYTGTYDFSCIDAQGRTVNLNNLTITVEVIVLPSNTIVITEVVPVDFGMFRRSRDLDSTIILPPILNPIPMVTPIVGGATYAFGAFSGEISLVNGTPGTTIQNLSLQNYGILTGANQTMPVLNMTHDYMGATFDATGALTLQVGAEVFMDSHQRTRVYTGTYDIYLENSIGTPSTLTGLIINLEVVKGALPVTMTENVGMDFGVILYGALASTVELRSDSDASTVLIGDAQALGLGGTPPSSRGELVITAEPNTSINISFSTGDVLTGPGSTIPIYSFLHDSGNNPILLDATGNLTVQLGARVDITATQAEGDYAGTYNMIIDYS
ncbi:MAG: DUF4402 domain-containing protein [bacterium]|nr:DUF4402 domain-containing protein [bacterium]